ncbi:MAG: CHAP domain-containing protein [Oscillospiraceae bacterium]|nr:CHAP domain-containing protein [Oscillospiraceae bacterium]
MKKLKQNGGFTLLELVIAMATGVLVFTAASTILLLGLRINNLTTGTIIRQNTTSTVLKVVERMASEGIITKVESDGDSWEIYNSEKVVFSYDSKRQAIFTGEAFDYETIVNGNPMMVGVYASNLVIDDNGVLTLAVETEDGSYQSSIYCRTLALPNQEEERTFDTTKVRGVFLDLLYDQYRMKGGQPNPGVILDSEERSTGKYYAEWYICEAKKNPEQWISGEWNKDTPWCACYISYCLSKLPASAFAQGASIPCYANVDDFIQFFDRNDEKEWTQTPSAGDIVFFDWLMGDDPSHVGVVLSVSGDQLYTIEGNSAGMIAVRQYSLSDKRIIGYGILPWSAE